MVAEALIKANPVYKFDEAIFQPERYINLVRDDLIQVIKRSKSPQLQESAELLKRIDVRDLYQMAGEALITKEQKSKLSAEDIASYDENGKLRASDLILNPFRIDWGNGE